MSWFSPDFALWHRAEQQRKGLGTGGSSKGTSAAARPLGGCQVSPRYPESARRRRDRIQPLPAVQYGEPDRVKCFGAVDQHAEPPGAGIDVHTHVVGAIEFDAPDWEQPVDAWMLPVEGMNDLGATNRSCAFADKLAGEGLGVLPILSATGAPLLSPK